MIKCWEPFWNSISSSFPQIQMPKLTYWTLIQGICLLILLTPFKYFCHVSNDFVSSNISSSLPKGNFCQRPKKKSIQFSTISIHFRELFPTGKKLWAAHAMGMGMGMLAGIDCIDWGLSGSLANWVWAEQTEAQALRISHVWDSKCCCNCRLSCQPFFFAFSLWLLGANKQNAD